MIEEEAQDCRPFPKKVSLIFCFVLNLRALARFLKISYCALGHEIRLLEICLLTTLFNIKQLYSSADLETLVTLLGRSRYALSNKQRTQPCISGKGCHSDRYINPLPAGYSLTVGAINDGPAHRRNLIGRRGILATRVAELEL